MDLEVQRFTNNGDTSIGGMFIEQSELLMFVLEDEPRNVKVANETRIPAGTYELEAIYDSPMAQKYKNKFEHKFLIGIKDVPGFTHIRIHIGNTDEHTAGCLLVGMGASLSGNYSISHSTDAYKKLYDLTHVAIEAGHATITIKDE